MKITNFFKRLNTIKHKYKVQFAIDILHISASISQQLTILIKRGSHKFSTTPGKLRKGKLDFKKQRIIFQQVTMFYDKSSGQYLTKDCEIKVLIHGEGGQRKLAGIVELDLGEYLNDKLQFKREQRELKKCPDKHQAKIGFEVYLKFLRESNSQTGSVVGELKSRKKEKEKQKEEQKQKQKEQENSKKVENIEDKKKKKDKKVLLLDDDIFEENNEERDKKVKNKDKNKDKNSKVPEVTVYYDKDLQDKQKSKIKDSLNNEQEQQYQQQYVNTPNPNNQQQYGLKTNPIILSSNPPPQPQQPFISDPPLLLHQQTQTFLSHLHLLQKQTNRLSHQNQQLQHKALSLKQRVSQSQQQRIAEIQQVSRDTTYDNIGKYQVRIKELQQKLDQSRRSKKENQKAYQQMMGKYQELKVGLDNGRVSASIDLESLEKQYKGKIEKVKEETKTKRVVVEKLEKEYKNMSEEMVELRREEEARQEEKKEMETRIMEIELAVNMLKMRVADAMNMAGMEGDSELMDFLIEQFSNDR